MKPGRLFAIATAALLAACSHPSVGGNAEDIATNALDNVEEVQADADDRAEHLEEAAQERAAEARRVGGRAGQALQNEAEDDMAEAAAARRAGARGAERIEEGEQSSIDAVGNTR